MLQNFRKTGKHFSPTWFFSHFVQKYDVFYLPKPTKYEIGDSFCMFDLKKLSPFGAVKG